MKAWIMLLALLVLATAPTGVAHLTSNIGKDRLVPPSAQRVPSEQPASYFSSAQTTGTRALTAWNLSTEWQGHLLNLYDRPDSGSLRCLPGSCPDAKWGSSPIVQRAMVSDASMASFGAPIANVAWTIAGQTAEISITDDAPDAPDGQNSALDIGLVTVFAGGLMSIQLRRRQESLKHSSLMTA